jgi:hypothetical protein
MSGPRPTPTYLKLLRGNPGRRPINKNEPKPEIPATQAIAAGLVVGLRARGGEAGCAGAMAYKPADDDRRRVPCRLLRRVFALAGGHRGARGDGGATPDRRGTVNWLLKQFLL